MPYSIPQRASVGERFFTSLGYSGMPKKMKKKLGETADYYMKLSQETTGMLHGGIDCSIVDPHIMTTSIITPPTLTVISANIVLAG